MKLIFAFCLVTVALFAACKKDNVSASNEYKVALKTCSPAIDGTNAFICLDTLLADTRCPKNAMCIWQGYAAVGVIFNENGNVHKFNMSTLNINHTGVNDTAINGYKIVLKDVEPYPDLTVPVPGTPVKAVFTITH